MVRFGCLEIISLSVVVERISVADDVNDMFLYNVEFFCAEWVRSEEIFVVQWSTVRVFVFVHIGL